MTSGRTSIDWDAARYDRQFSFVSSYGEDLLDLLAPQPGERVLDLGCGTGELMARIAERGAEVVGIDGSAEMVAAARDRLPGADVRVADGHFFTLDEPVDAVFSNAALHWMTRPHEVVRSVAGALVPGGRFVAEMGGAGNVANVLDSFRTALRDEGLPDDVRSPWWFPSVGQQAAVLEAGGFRVARAEHFPRPTPLHDCPDGVADWLRMFGAPLLAAVPPDRVDGVLVRTKELARPRLFRDGVWYADYWRLRFVAVKEPSG